MLGTVTQSPRPSWSIAIPSGTRIIRRQPRQPSSDCSRYSPPACMDVLLIETGGHKVISADFIAAQALPTVYQGAACWFGMLVLYLRLGYSQFSHFQSSVLMMVRGWRCVSAHAGPACFALGETRQGFAFNLPPHAAHRARPWHQTQSRPVPISTPRCAHGARAASQAGARCNAFQRLRWACGP